MKSPVTPVSVSRFQNGSQSEEPDLLVTEEPLEIRLKFRANDDLHERRLAVTMRTPGHDFELVVGFLVSEGIISAYTDINKIFYCEEIRSEEEKGNVVIVVLRTELFNIDQVFSRNFYMTSSCGVCGKSSIESVHVQCKSTLQPKAPLVSAALVSSVPDLVRKSQQVFEHTGGLHASALLDADGKILVVREDVGRHNALDKLIGARSIEGKSNENTMLFVSGRMSFELVQKAFVAGIPIMIAVGAPSSLAVQMATDCNMTLIGFARDNRFNIYTGVERIARS